MQKDLIEEFFNKKLVTSHHTRKSYRANINKYFSLLNKDINTYFSNEKTLDEYESDLNIVYMLMDKQKVPLLTRRTFFNAVKQFMFTIDKRTKGLDFWDTLKTRVRGADPISEKFQLNNQDIKTLLSHGDTCLRAGGLIMSSTGCRLGELLALTEDDIDTTATPSVVTIRGTYDPKEPGNIKQLTKTKKQRTSFLTPEATASYLEWMKERPRYLAVAVSKSRFKKDESDQRIFPMSDENYREKWVNMVKKSGMFKKDKKTSRLTLHPHCMRSFFRSYLGNRDLSEHLMGHVTGMDKYYKNMKKEDLAREYMKVMYNLVIFEKKPDLSQLTDDMDKLKQENKELKEDMDKLMRKIMLMEK